MDQQPTNQNQQKGMRNRTTAMIIGILVGIVAVLLVVNALMKGRPVDKSNVNVGVVNGNQQTNQNVNVLTNTNQPTVIDNTNQPPEVITSSIDTSDWKTYRNEKCNLQTKFPPNWEVKEEIVKSDITNEMMTRLNIVPTKKRTYRDPEGDVNEIPEVVINCYQKDSAEKVSRALGFGIIGSAKKVKIGNIVVTLRDAPPEYNPEYGDNRLLEAIIDGNKTILISSWGYDSEIFFGVLKTLSLL